MINKTLALLLVLMLSSSLLFSGIAVASTASNSVLINEIMTAGAESNKDEFIELVNIGNDDIDLAGWTVEYVNSSGAVTVIFTFSTNSILAKDGYFLGVLSQTPASLFLNNLSPKFEYSLGGQYGMAVSSGSLVLKNNYSDVIDTVSWTDRATSSDLNIVPGMAKSKSIERIVTDSKIANTGVVGTDFKVNTIPTPTVINDVSVIITPEDPPAAADPNNPNGGVTEETPTDPGSSTTDPNSGTPSESTPNPDNTTQNPAEQNPIPVTETPTYLPLAINELFIDPQSPLTDANDEFVEIYNPNNTELSLSGYTLLAGTSSNYRHTFGANDVIAANGFVVVSSKDTAIALSNSGGLVLLKDTSGNTVSTVTYEEARPGESWSENNLGQWQWSTTVTSGSINIITLALPPPVKATAAAIGASTKKATSSISKAKTTTTTPKAASTKVAKATAVKAAADTKDYSKIVDAPVFVPVWLLALIGGLAVIYLGYEYRFEISNKIYQLRQYRANR